MPLLPLPTNGAAIDQGDLPIVDETSVAALEPLLVNQADIAPIRDAIRSALVAMFTYYQNQTSGAAMQSNVLFATGQYLDGLGRDEGVYRDLASEPYTQVGDSAYRARIIAQNGTVTPAAICAAVNTLLAPFTATPCRYLESMLDRGYVRTNSTNPNTVYIRNGQVVGNCDPTYLDRVYPDDATNNFGFSLPNRRPGGFFCFSDITGRYFVLRVPLLTLLDTSGAFAMFPFTQQGIGSSIIQINPETQYGYGMFCTNGSVTAPTWWDFFRSNSNTSQSIYQTIVNTVNRLVGHSVRWELVADPILA